MSSPIIYLSVPVRYAAVMRAYKFLDMKFGLKSLRERRLKQSRINELNDPFELTPFDITDPQLRAAFLNTRNDIHDNRGVLCFSADWNDPVIWAHYSDKHRGLCLGFEIPKMAEDPGDEESGYVKYIEDPLNFPANFSELEEKERLQIVRSILFTKFRHWQYEHEIRVWATLEEEENGLYFVEFGEELNIVEVIVGAKCELPRSQITEALGPAVSEVNMIKARAAYDRFQIVKDETWA